MTVEQLIAELKKVPPDYIVLMFEAEDEVAYNVMEVDFAPSLFDYSTRFDLEVRTDDMNVGAVILK